MNGVLLTISGAHTAWLSAHGSCLSVHTSKAVEGMLSRRCLIPQGTAKSRTDTICIFFVLSPMGRLVGLNMEQGRRRGK